MDEGFEPTKWWQVVDRAGKLWCETSIQREAVESMRPGDVLYRLYARTEYRRVEQ